MTLAEKYHEETIKLMKKKGEKLAEDIKQEILQVVQDTLTDGDFEAYVEVPLGSSEYAKAFLIGEGFLVEEKSMSSSALKCIFRVKY